MPFSSPGEAFASTFDPAGLANIQLQIHGQQQTQELRNIQEQRLHLQEQQGEVSTEQKQMKMQSDFLAEGARNKTLSPFQLVSGYNVLLEKMMGPQFRLGGQDVDSVYAMADINKFLNAGDFDNEQIDKDLLRITPGILQEEFRNKLMQARTQQGLKRRAEESGLPSTPSDISSYQSSKSMEEQFAKTAIVSPLAKAAQQRLEEQTKRLQLSNALNETTVDLVGPEKRAADKLSESTKPFIGLMEKTGRIQNPQERANLETKDFKEYKNTIAKMQPGIDSNYAKYDGEASKLQINMEKWVAGGNGEDRSEYQAMKVRSDGLNAVKNYYKAASDYASDMTPSKWNKVVLAQNALRQTYDDAIRSGRQNNTAMLAINQQRMSLAQSKFDIGQIKEQQVAGAQQELAKSGIKPKDEGFLQKAGEIATKHGVKVSDITNILHGPGTEVTVINEKQTAEAAGKYTMMTNAIAELSQVRNFLFDAQGNVNRSVLLKAAPGKGIPFTEGRTMNAVMEDVISTKYRIETGAAGNEQEVKSMVTRFQPSALDSDDLVKDKLARMEWWLKATVSTVDPKGELRKRADALNPTPKSHQQFLDLKNKFPQADDETIIGFLAGRK